MTPWRSSFQEGEGVGGAVGDESPNAQAGQTPHGGRVVHGRLEECRISMRNIRRDIIKDLKDYEKEKLISEDDLKTAEEELQKLTERMADEEVERIGEKKQKEIMEV